MEFNRITTLEEAKNLCKIMPDVVAVDTEYVKGDPRTTKLLSIIVADSDRAWSLPPHFLPVLSATLRARKLIFLQDYNHCDTIILLKNGCDLRETYCVNTIDLHHLLNENVNHDLGSRVLENFKDNYKSEFWGKYGSFEDAPQDEALEYECKDAIYTYRLGIADIKKVNTELLEHIRQLSLALLDTEVNGITVDVGLIEKTKLEMQQQIDEYLPKLREEFSNECQTWELKKWREEILKRSTDKGRAGVKRPQFSFTSDSQLKSLLYDENLLGLPVKRKTKSRAPSTDYEAIEELADLDPRLHTLLKYKEIKTIFNTFVIGLSERVDQGVIYPHFNVSGTTTGRISHSDPNMGNLPREGVYRNFFLPRPGTSIIGADYTQLEVVIEANLTNDPNLLKIINEGVSKHDITAQGLGIDRNSAKTLNFALQYGAGVGKVRKLLGVSQEDAEDIFKRYWELYSGVGALKQKTNQELEQTGQITNLAGRVRHFPKTEGYWDLEKQRRQAYNFKIQGVAGEACNRAYYRFHNYAKSSGIGMGMFTVHDEIVAQVKTEYAEEAKKKLVEFMEQSTQDFRFKYKLQAKAYGPLAKWEKT